MEQPVADQFAAVFLPDVKDDEVACQHPCIDDKKGRGRSNNILGDQHAAKKQRGLLGYRQSDATENQESKKTKAGELIDEVSVFDHVITPCPFQVKKYPPAPFQGESWGRGMC